MAILVTGATGFLGAVLMPLLVRRFGASALTAYVLPGVGDVAPDEADIFTRPAAGNRLAGQDVCGQRRRSESPDE